jgi:type III secretion protein U
MSTNDGGGEKTEQPTPKRLRDARRDGDVPKSRDLTQTVTTLAWTLVLLGLSGYFSDRLGSLLEFSWTQVDLSSAHALLDAGVAAAQTLVLLTVVPLAIVGACGLVAEFLQAGGVFAPKRLVPQFSRLNPAEGAKRLFSKEH